MQNAGATAVLLVSHGSHSPQWRQTLLEVEAEVRDDVLACEHVAALESAFMEYTEPSIATRLREFDEAGYDNVIIIPLLLTVSSHSFDDIPTIAGLKEDRLTSETLSLEGVDIYHAKAHVEIAPLLDFTDVLEKNVIRRVKQLSSEPAKEGVVLVAYGDQQYDDEWTALLQRIGRSVNSQLQIETCRHAWCGHVAHYKPDMTEAAIDQVLAEKETAIVIPLLVSIDETFQGRIIGGAVANVDAGPRVRYRRDAILPDENVAGWIVSTCQQIEAHGGRLPAASE